MPPPNFRPGMPQRPLGTQPTFQTKPTTSAPISGSLIIPGTLNKFSRNDSPDCGRCIVLVGKPGIGKTSFCAQAPVPLFICGPLETGIIDLIERGRVPVTKEQVVVPQSYADLKEILQSLATTSHSIKTVVIEGYTEWEKLCMNAACVGRFGGNWGKAGFMNFQEGPKTCAARDLPESLVLLQNLRDKGINVLITAHTMVKAQANAEGAAFEGESPYFISKDMWQCVEGWAENIVYMVYQVQTQKDVDGKNRVAGGAPTLVCHRNGTYQGKNKWGINTFISIDGLDSAEAYKALCVAARMNPQTLRYTA